MKYRNDSLWLLHCNNLRLYPLIISVIFILFFSFNNTAYGDCLSDCKTWCSQKYAGNNDKVKQEKAECIEGCHDAFLDCCIDHSIYSTQKCEQGRRQNVSDIPYDIGYRHSLKCCTGY